MRNTALPDPQPPCCIPAVSRQCEVGDRVVVDVGGMAYGPHAVARHAGFVLFVRGAVPGDRAEVEVRERRRNHAFADVVRLEHSSPHRRQPPCPIAGRCGGCPWQQIGYEFQLAAKRDIVSEQLARVAGLTPEVAAVAPSPRVYGYRRRIKLRVEAGRVGFYAGGTHDLVQIAHCALAESGVDAMIGAAAALARRLAAGLRRLEIVARHDAADGVVLLGEYEGRWPVTFDTVCTEWLASTPRCAGLEMRGRGWLHRWGDMGIACAPEADLELPLDAAAFTQVNPIANRTLVATVIALLGEVAGHDVLEAYAGAGNFSAPLARRGARVSAVEQSPAACRSARQAAARAEFPWSVEEGTVGAVLDRLAAAGARYDSVLLDPPRGGAAEAIPALLRIDAPRLVYVSCDPSTLARDLKALAARYRITAVRPIDMFPHTYHVETVVRCDRH